jgi:hypothetical protein
MSIVLIIVGIIALPFILALFTKKSYALKREIIINQPKAVVFDYLKHIKNQDNFNKWVQMDPNMKKEFRGVDGTKGFVYGWNGNKKAGEGEMEIKDITEGALVDIEIRFVRPFAGISKVPMSTETIAENQTKVTWGVSSTMKYPMNIMLLFMSMDKLLGNDMVQSLNNLKNQLENK